MSSSKRKIETMSSSTASDEVFEYKRRGQTVPKDVVSVKFHPSVIEVTNDAFRINEVDDVAFRNCQQLREVILNKGLQMIGKSAFYGCTSLKSINIPSTVTKIGRYAFGDCNSLCELVLNDGLREIGEYTFRGSESLESIQLPSTVSEIGHHAFVCCSSLREVVLSDGLEKIGRNAFVHCNALQSITIPSTVDEIGDMTFGYCRNLREVVLKEGVKMIESNAFRDCSSIERITIPSTIKIKRLAFIDCSGLMEVVIHSEEVQIDDEAFKGCISLERFKFPSLWTRLYNVIQAGQTDIEAKLDNISSVEWRSGELSIPSVHQEIDDDGGWGTVTLVKVDKEKLDKIVRLIRYYEIKEATSLFELALWKAKIDEVDDTETDINRDMHRIEVPGPVKDRILHYIGYKHNV